MNTTKGARRIFWMVRLLGGLGLAMVLVMIGQIGLQLKSIRATRVRLQGEQSALSQTSQEISQRAVEARREIQGVLDENIPLSQRSDAVTRLSRTVHQLLNSTSGSVASESLQKLDSLANDMMALEQSALLWRFKYDVVWQDESEQRTSAQVRNLITALRGLVETVEGERRLQEAMQFKHWQTAQGEAAARIATIIATEQGKPQIRGLAEFKTALAEVARLVEKFGSEEQEDDLADLKDNNLEPALERLSYDADFLERIGKGDLLEDLKIAIFGQGYMVDEAHQNILVGRGGLYSLWQDTLMLRHGREKLHENLNVVSTTLTLLEQRCRIGSIPLPGARRTDGANPLFKLAPDDAFRRLLFSTVFLASMADFLRNPRSGRCHRIGEIGSRVRAAES